MLLPYLFLLIGILCIFLEFFLPGGILGGFGGLLCLAGLVIEIMRAGSFIDVLVYAVVGALATVLVIWLALRRIKNAKSDSDFYLNNDQEGYKASSYPLELVGLEAETLSSCHPSGFISVNGNRHQAVSQSGFIEKGKKIKIIDGKGAYLVVIKI